MATDVLNLAPVVMNEYVTVNAGQLVSAPASILLSNDADPEGDALSIVKFGQASHGAFAQAADGTVSYVSAPGFVGEDSVTYVVQDAAGNQTTGTIYFNVVGTANVPPTLQDDYATVTAGAAVTANPNVLLGNDSDANGDALTIVGFGKPSVGTLVQNADGTITYTAPPDYAGPATFTYTVSDGKGGEATATVNLVVTPTINVPPTLQNEYVTVQAGVGVTADPSLLLANDGDANGDALTIVRYGKPTVGTLVQNPDGTITYTAPQDYSGPATFTYTVSDSKGGEATATVFLTVEPSTNAAPVAGDDAANVTHAGSVIINVLANDTDANGDKLTVSGINQPANGSAVLNADGTVTYKANAGYSGTDTFTYTVSDGKGGTSTATVAVQVAAAPNVAPVAGNDAANVAHAGSVNINVLANDTDANGDKLTVSGVNQPANGSAVLNADGTVTYKANAGYSGTDTFTYTVSDGKGGTATATVAVQVAPKVVDLSAPDLTANTDSGFSNSDNYTNFTRPGFVIGAMPKAGDVPNLYVDGVKVLSTYNAETGIITPWNALIEGVHQISYSYTNAAGVESARSEALTFRVDITAPTVAAPDLMVASDLGTSNTDNLTSDNTPTFYLKAGSNTLAGQDAVSDKVTMFVDGVEVASTYNAATGELTATAPIADGAHVITAKLTDAAGNVSAASAGLTVNINTSVPAASVNTPDLLTTADTGASNVDNITANTRPGFLVGEKIPGGDILLLVDGVQVAATYDSVAKTLTPTMALSEGLHKISMINVSPSGVKSAASPALTIDIDAVKEAPATAPDLAANSDSGFSNSDNYTNSTMPGFVIGATPKAGDVPNLYVDGVKVQCTYNLASGIITPYRALTEGVHQISYSYTNAAGVESARSEALTFRVDITAPTVAAPDLMVASDLGTSNTDNLTSDNTPTFYVKAGSNTLAGQDAVSDKVTMFVDGVEVASTYNAATGELTAAAPIADGAHVITAKLTDAAGNVSAASAGLTVNINTSVPAASVNTPDLLTTADTGRSNVDNITANLKPGFVVGEKIPGGDVLLLVDGVEVAATYDAVAKTLTPTVALSEGLHQISMINVSPSGVKSAASPALTIDVDAVKETPTNGADMVAASDSGLSQTDNITNNTRPSFAVGAPPKAGDVMNLYIDNKKVDAVYDEAAGTLTPVTPLTSGQHWVAWSVTNAAGVESGLAAIGDRSGVVASYFTSNWNLMGSEVIPTANQSWGFGGPVGMTDNFITQYSGKIVPLKTGEYSFQSWADNGVSLWVDNKLLIDDVRYEAWGFRTSGPIMLEAGKEYPITLVHRENLGSAGIDLRWREPGATDFVGVPTGSAQTGGLYAYAGDLITIDTAAPTATKPDMLATSDRGTSSVDDLTSDNRPVFSVGTVAATDRVTLWVDGKEVAATYDVAKGTIQPESAIADGAHSVSLKVTDLAGNVSAASAELSVRIDTRTPSAPVNQPDMLNADDTGISNTDNITANTQPRFIVGEVPPSGKIELLVDGQVVAGTYDAVGKTIKPTAPLAEGTHDVSMRYVSESGVASAASPALSIEIDAVADPVVVNRVSLNLVAFEESQPVDPTYTMAALPEVGGHVVQAYSLAAPISASNTAESVSSLSGGYSDEQSLDLRDLLVMDTALFATNTTAEAQANADVSGTSTLASADMGSATLMGLVGDPGSFTGLFKEADQATYQQF